MSKIERVWVYTDAGLQERITVVRFDVRQRIEHLLVTLCTAILALTGLPQKFHDETWARWLISTMGGIEVTRTFHRNFAIILTVVAVYHVLNVVYQIFSRRARLTMMPTAKDVSDAFVMLRYFMGRSKEKPQFDRYSFGEKFEYWALVWGLVIMGITGFIVWFPTKVTIYFSGEIVPAAKMAHGWEALLAVLALITWHSWNVHLRKFDTSIFTGRLSKMEMMEEHPLEYARIMAEETELAVIRPDVGDDTSGGS
ncbi:MAG: formate dehydrogenase subunit gamma [Anaerolineae bacterium]